MTEHQEIQISFQRTVNKCVTVLFCVVLLSGALYFKIESNEKVEMEKLRIVEKYYEETIDSYEGKGLKHELK